MTQLIPTEADREAAADLYLDLEGPPYSPKDLAEAEAHRTGAYDAHPAVQAFASYALAVRIEALGEAAKVADQYSQARRAASKAAKSLKRHSEARDHESMAIEGVHIASAIRALIPTGAE